MGEAASFRGLLGYITGLRFLASWRCNADAGEECGVILVLYSFASIGVLLHGMAASLPQDFQGTCCGIVRGWKLTKRVKERGVCLISCCSWPR